MQWWTWDFCSIGATSFAHLVIVIWSSKFICRLTTSTLASSSSKTRQRPTESMRPRPLNYSLPFIHFIALWLLSCIYVSKKPLICCKGLKHEGRGDLWLTLASATAGFLSSSLLYPTLPWPQMCPLEVSLSRSHSRLQGHCSAAQPLLWPLQGGCRHQEPQTSDALICLPTVSDTFFGPYRLMLVCIK